MKLGLKNDEVKLVPYTEEWNSEYRRVKQAIQKNINMLDNHIQHIGSTAIKNMVAKPILDILIGIEDINNVDDSVIRGLKEIGFLRLRVERPAKIIFAKFTDNTYKEKTHFIHMVEQGKEHWHNLVFFRDYLNSNEGAKQEYKNIKMEFVQNNSRGISEYTNHKEDFVKAICSKRFGLGMN